MFLNRESLDQVSNSKAPEAEAPKSGSPVPPIVETTPCEGALTESPELISTMAVELTTARAETEALMEGIKEVFHVCGKRGRSRGNFKVDQSDVVGSESTKTHFTGRP